jgi:uncharacterized membrane protein YqaE (UPF0057 family)
LVWKKEKAGQEVFCPVCKFVYRLPMEKPKALEGIGDSIICPNANCGFRGGSLVKSRGDMAIAFLLMIIGLVPGLIYMLACNGKDLVCPKCGVFVRRV